MISKLMPNETSVATIVSKLNDVIEAIPVSMSIDQPAASVINRDATDCIHAAVCFFLMYNYPVHHPCDKSCKFYAKN
jgi:hypothetical protein